MIRFGILLGVSKYSPRKLEELAKDSKQINLSMILNLSETSLLAIWRYRS